MAALSKLQICFKENPKDLETLALLARAFDKLGQPAKSIEVQKEAARIAKDAGKLDHFNALVEALLTRAPNDEGVRQLAAMRAAEQRPRTGRTSRPRSGAAASPLRAGTRSGSHSRPRSSWTSTTPRSSSTRTRRLRRRRPSRSASRSPPATSTSLHAPARPAASGGAGARLRQILSRVDAYRHAKDYDHAVALLFEAVEELPGARELREKLCDVLIEAGDQAEAVRQMLAFARWLAGDGRRRGRHAHPRRGAPARAGAARSHAMLRELGYAVPTEEAAEYAADAQQPATRRAEGPCGRRDAAPAPYDPSAPLPSYDLEEVSADEALRCGDAAHHRAFAPSQLDNPFGEAPLPSFPIDDEAAALRRRSRDSAEIAVPQSPPVGRRSSASPAPGSPSPVPPPYAGASGRSRPRRASASSTRRRSRRSSSSPRTGCSTRRATCSRSSSRACRTTRSCSSACASSRSTPPPRRATRAARARCPGRGPAVRAQPGPRASRIAASTSPPRSTRSTRSTPARSRGARPGPEPGQRRVGLRAVQGRRRRADLRVDAATHYDLGVAYKEMGLFTDAITEFELAARDPGRECVCQSMIGMIHREHGNIDAAIDAFIRGLHAAGEDARAGAGAHLRDRRLLRGAARAGPGALLLPARRADRPGATPTCAGPSAERVRRLEPAPVAQARPRWRWARRASTSSTPCSTTCSAAASCLSPGSVEAGALRGLTRRAGMLLARGEAQGRVHLGVVTLAALRGAPVLEPRGPPAARPPFTFADMGGYLERAQTSIDFPGEPRGYFALFPWGTHWLRSRW